MSSSAEEDSDSDGVDDDDDETIDYRKYADSDDSSIDEEDDFDIKYENIGNIYCDLERIMECFGGFVVEIFMEEGVDISFDDDCVTSEENGTFSCGNDSTDYLLQKYREEEPNLSFSCRNNENELREKEEYNCNNRDEVETIPHNGEERRDIIMGSSVNDEYSSEERVGSFESYQTLSDGNDSSYEDDEEEVEDEDGELSMLSDDIRPYGCYERERQVNVLNLYIHIYILPR